MIFRAGEVQELSKVEHNPYPKHYVYVNALLKPARAPDIHFETERFPWSTYRIKEQYIGQHNLLDIILLQLTTNLFCYKIYPLNCNGDTQAWLIESCYSDDDCNCWSSVDNWDNKEAMEFLDRMDKILDNQSEYKFQSVNTFTTNTKIMDRKDI